MNPVSQNASFDLSLATPQGRRAWAIAAILFGGAMLLDIATGHGDRSQATSRVETQVIKPHAVEPYADRRATRVGSAFVSAKTRSEAAAWSEALAGESRLSLSPARVRHAS